MEANGKQNHGQANSMKLSRELGKIPVEKYRMPTDGRKWKAAAQNRMALADWLGTHGDGDGTRIFPAVSTMAKKFGWSEAKTYYILADLRKLRLLENTPHYSDPKHHRTRVRQMNVAAFLTDSSGVQDSRSQDSKIEQECKIQDSKIEGQDSKIEPQDSKHTLETTVTPTVTLTDTKASPYSPPLKNAKGDAIVERFTPFEILDARSTGRWKRQNRMTRRMLNEVPLEELRFLTYQQLDAIDSAPPYAPNRTARQKVARSLKVAMMLRSRTDEK